MTLNSQHPYDAGGASSSSDAMSLSGLLYALDLHASEITSSGDDGTTTSSAMSSASVSEPSMSGGNGACNLSMSGGNGAAPPTVSGGSEGSSTVSTELRRWAVGDCVLHFQKDQDTRVLAIVFADVGLGDAIPGRLASDMLHGRGGAG